MIKNISIEYCTSWGYLSKAVGLTKNLLENHTNNIENLTLIPSSGGIFEVKVNDTLVFSKKELNRFPNENEIEDIIKEKYRFGNP